MRLSTLVLSSVALYATNVASRPVKRDVDPSLVPPFGLQAGLNPTGTGDCDGIPGADGTPIKIPCDCPPPLDEFLQSLNANVNAGFVINNPTVKLSFPTDSSKASQSARLNAAAVTLQNLHGPGKGCPVASTTFSAQQKTINALPDTPAPASSPAAAVATQPATTAPAPSPSPANNAVNANLPSAAQIAALAPPLGFTSGKNPTGTGDCDGAVNGSNGQPIKIPCACPPSQDVYIQSLTANVLAGKAVNNPTVKVTFPVDNSKASQSARLTAASITLQNLNGPGKGCPVVSTTFSAQQQAINAEPDNLAASPASTKPVQASPSPSKAAVPSPVPTNNAAAVPSADQIAALAPPLGFQSGLNPTGTGDCDGAVNGADGKPIKIPCQCPPAQDIYIQSLVANVQAGHAINNTVVKVSFPLDNSKNSQSARLTAASITLQNLNGPGKGCPVAATTFSAQQKAINAEPDTPASSSPAPASAAAPVSSAQASPSPSASKAAASSPVPTNVAAGTTSADQIAALAPPLGFQSGLNPTGTGDCDGAVNGADGKPIKIPCQCPPAQDVYIKSLVANVQAGFAINNTVVKVSFPLDNSKNSQSARLTAASITLQNLNGPGKGCPVASTTFSAQQKAINAEPNTQAAVAVTPAASAAAPQATTPAPAPSLAPAQASGNGTPSAAQIAALAPNLGFQSGLNPTGTGDCDGAVKGSNGQPIKVPCSCPPAQDVYIKALQQNVAAGFAVNNPTVKVSFPVDNSNASQSTRITAALITLQNLNGPGKGCPAASTTLLAQQKAL